jgi:hypothetical protein
MPTSAAATKYPVLDRHYENLKELSSILEERRNEGQVGSMTVQDLDLFPDEGSASPIADHQLYSVHAMTPFASAIAWWQDAMDFALKLRRGAALMPESSPTVEDEFSQASSKALAAYSEAIAEAIRNDDKPLDKTKEAVIEYRKFTRRAAGIISRLFPELNHEALLQIP